MKKGNRKSIKAADIKVSPKKKYLFVPAEKESFIVSQQDETLVIPQKKSANKKSKLVAFAQKPIVIIITLIIMFLGGVPGIINIIDYANRKSKFNFRTQAIIVGTADTLGRVQTEMIISGAITNSGEKPLFPATFIARLKYDGKTIDLLRRMIPHILKEEKL